MTHSRYPHLLSPGRLGPLQLRNRICVTAMGVSLAEDDGSCGDRLIAYHEEQARGGAGLIIMGATGVSLPVGGVQRNQIDISHDRFLPGLSRLAETVHRHGARIAAQLHHGGLNAGYAAAVHGVPLWTPSLPLPPEPGDFFSAYLPEEIDSSRMIMPQIHEMTEDDIAGVIADFVAGALRAKAAGLDGVEIHGGHGYVLSSFLSPSTNRRTDRYGGTFENRAQLMVETVAAVRAAVGPDFAMWCKLDTREVGKANGITIEDACQTARWLEQAGAHAITATSYHNTSHGKLHSESNIPHPPELNMPGAAAIKAAVSIPVIASGRIEPEAADARIGKGDCDFVAMGRKLLADPFLPAKLAKGRAQDVRPCIYCYTCVSCIYIGTSVRCAVNPELAFEYQRPAVVNGQARRRIAVVGSGPAGMEAARRLALAGQNVALFESGDRLGGALRFASLAYEPNEHLLDWLEHQLSQVPVDVRLGTCATPELLREWGADEVVVATGAIRELPPIPGSDQAHVLSGDDLRSLMLGKSNPTLNEKVGLGARLAAKVGAATGLTANPGFVRKASRQWMPLGSRIAIIGGELVGLELAEFLAERHREVTVVEESGNLGRGLTVVRRARLVAELREHGVSLHTGASGIVILPDGIEFTGLDGDRVKVNADHVIVATGARSDSTLADELVAAGFTVHEVGDGSGVGYIEGAMRSAAEAVGRIII